MSAEALISETFFVFSEDEFFFEVMKTMTQRAFLFCLDENFTWGFYETKDVFLFRAHKSMCVSLSVCVYAS